MNFTNAGAPSCLNEQNATQHGQSASLKSHPILAGNTKSLRVTYSGKTSHYNDVMMGAMASQISGVSIVCSTVCWECRSKKTPKLRVTGLCDGNPPVTGEFPPQKASNAENVSIWWRHHGSLRHGKRWVWQISKSCVQQAWPFLMTSYSSGKCYNTSFQENANR